MTKNELDYIPLFRCECLHEGIVVERLDWDEAPWQLCIALYSFGENSGGVAWRERLRHIWNILRYGRPHADQVTFDEATARSFANQILAELDSWKK